MAWYYHLNGNTQGPVDAPELDRLVATSILTPDTLVWTEGMAQWQPYSSSRQETAIPGMPPVVTASCVECGRSFPEAEMLRYENDWVCPTCKPIFFQRIKEGVAPRGNLVLATIGHRFAAVFIDGLLILFVSGILLAPYYMSIFSGFQEVARHPQTPYAPPVLSWPFRLYVDVVSYGVPAAYEIFLIGAYGATLGKMLMKIKVVTAEGGRVSYARATGRHFAKILSGIILYIGYLMAFWDDEKRALHDRMCRTRVVVSNVS
jgi:uncharacterized RDD family membrane protein YckC